MNTAGIAKASLTAAKIIVQGLLVLAVVGGGSAQGQDSTPHGQIVNLLCSAPQGAAQVAKCAAMERQILDATVFIRFTLHCGHNGDRSGVILIPSHATIMDSHTLLTHDHYYPLSNPACMVASLEVARAQGEPLAELEDPGVLDDLARQLRPGPASNGNQTRVVRFPMPLFTSVPDLTFDASDPTTSNDDFLRWGELAEVNWEPYPKAIRVQWVRPVALERPGAALGLVVDQAVEIGASGGGVFRITPDGIVHVGNVWGTWKDDNASIVALNQAAVPWPGSPK